MAALSPGRCVAYAVAAGAHTWRTAPRPRGRSGRDAEKACVHWIKRYGLISSALSPYMIAHRPGDIPTRCWKLRRPPGEIRFVRGDIRNYAVG